jgi:hypothetical protein
MKRLLS